MFVVKWGGALPGGDILNKAAYIDIIYLKKIAYKLKSYGYTLITTNTQGIIIEEIKDYPDPFEPGILLKEDKPTEVTGEFFLFYDHLPEHIKKEIKIYINKTEE